MKKKTFFDSFESFCLTRIRGIFICKAIQLLNFCATEHARKIVSKVALEQNQSHGTERRVLLSFVFSKMNSQLSIAIIPQRKSNGHLARFVQNLARRCDVLQDFLAA